MRLRAPALVEHGPSRLVQCLKKANGLDQESEQLDGKRSELKSSANEIDQLKSQIEMRCELVNRSNQASIDRFNADVDRYNTIADRLKREEDIFNGLVGTHNGHVNGYNVECAKNYYQDDMKSARKLAGI